ncbi:hypothetical protein [Stenotrophomonas sp. AB1(2024)]|uniref:hypothetical protein n=1 Tax=Stenotrophomonas sp. AB1(2024) TaxID=3132215 RepID=UPI0030A4CD06
MSNDVEFMKIGSVRTTNVLYFTGGLRAVETTDRGLALLPLRGEGELVALCDFTWPALLSLTQECGSRFVGYSQEFEGKGVSEAFWNPGIGRLTKGLFAADLWAAISSNSDASGDLDYARAATSVSTSLMSAGHRIRDLSVHHHQQLCWAIKDREPEASFSNLPLSDIYRDFQALATDLCGARDYLAKVAGFQLGLKDSADSMARLEGAVGSKVDEILDPLVRHLFANWGKKADPKWLRELGDIRNKLVHRLPMAVDPQTRLLILHSHSTSRGTVETIRLSESRHERGNRPQQVDPFVLFSEMYDRVEQLCSVTAGFAKYPADLPTFRARR